MALSKGNQWLREHPYFLPALLFFIFGALLRFIALGSFPAGINQDEASAGYEAWSLLHYGVDRNGYSWPVLFVSWGSGQNVLYSYLLIPFVAVGGLSPLVIRIPAALFGTVSLFLAHRIGTYFWGESGGFWSLVFLSVNPWHLMLSRWALESNLLPFCLLSGLYFVLKAIRSSPAFLIPAAISYALCLYAYGTSFFLLPFFLVGAVIYILKKKMISLKWMGIAAFVFLFLSFPIVFCQLRNILGLPGIQIGRISLPLLTETRQASASLFGGGNYWNNLLNATKILWQGDGYTYNTISPFGILYPYGLILSLLGFILLIFRKQWAENHLFFLWIWIIPSLLVSGLIDGNVNRLNFLFLPFILLQAYLIHTLTESKVYLNILSSLILLTVVTFFSISYCRISTSFPSFESTALKDVLDEAASSESETILVTDRINMPYIYVLFYEQIPPNEFYSQVEYKNPGAPFQYPKSFGRWKFGDDPNPGDQVVVKYQDIWYCYTYY